MDLQTLIITASNPFSMFRHWGLFHPAKALNSFVVLSFVFFCLAAYGLCFVNPPESFGKSNNFGISDTFVSDTVLGYKSPTTNNSFESVCPDNRSFCFPSTLSGFYRKEKSAASSGDSGSQYVGPLCVQLTQDSRQASSKNLSSDYGMFKLHNGGFISCSLNSREGVDDVQLLQTEVGHKNDASFCGGSFLKQKATHYPSKNYEMSKSSSLDGSFAPNVRIDPSVLDWGQTYLYSPSVAFLTVANTCNDSILHLYEPFSTDVQFYPCNFSEVSLEPGESALICFVFFPSCLGMSSAHLILQTSSGGFILEAEGYAIESPFGLKPFLRLKISSGGRLSKNFSLFNPYDETLYVKEITASLSVALGHNSVETEAVCNLNNFQVFDNPLFPIIKDRLVVKTSQIDSPIVAIRPHRNWEVDPHSSETLMDIDITVGLEGKIFGAFCLHLLRSSQNQSDTIMVPIEAEVDSHSGYDTVGLFVSATLEVLAACDGGETAITISLRNDAPHVLSFVEVLQVADAKLFHIKYMKGLLLFPSTVTQVGIIYCSHLHLDLHDMANKVSNLQENCNLIVFTNDSISSQIEIQCEDILHICLEHQRLSSVGVEDQSELIKSGNLRAGYVGRSMQLQSNVKVIETADVDELVLGNWVSQGTSGGMSVLVDHEVLFPMIEVGSYISRWITVKNPSQYPVMMQLILNSGEIIDECRGPDDLLHLSSSGSLVLDKAATPTKYGFSVPKSAVKEAYVHPYHFATLGPIIFHPSNRCGWSGSALIRNNLSGVEWIPLRGFGGLLSLVLLEGSEHVQSIDFDLKMPKPLNFSLQFPYSFLYMKEMTSACSQHLVKELYAKNTGDLPLEVIRIRVSGRDCGLDGFKIHACRGFALEPGESSKLLISYQTDFSAAMVHQDLELALATGIFLIPMKASFPYDVLGNCKKSMFWMRVKRSFLGSLLVASFILLVFYFIFPQTIALGSFDYLCKSDGNSIHNTLKCAGKTSFSPCNQRKSKSSISGKNNDLICSVGKDTTSTMQLSSGNCPYGQGKSSEQEITQNHKRISNLLDTPNERKLPSTAVQNSDMMQASQQGNLMVKTGKEKCRRRKRKSLGAKLAALSEVSSSQSGNSTPSSPLSPVASATAKCNWPLSPDVEQPTGAHGLITPVAAHHSESVRASASACKVTMPRPGAPVKCCSNNLSSPEVPHSASTSAAVIPVKIPSATLTLPGAPSPSSLMSTSTLTLDARAPGSKLHDKKAGETGNAGLAEEYAYDIWGGHFSGLHLLVPKNVTSMKSSPAEKNFDSFFVRGPQILMTNYGED